MPSTHLSLHYHIVFSTKGREPYNDVNWRGRLHEYIGGLIHAAEGIPEAVGGTENHVHVLAGLRATQALSAFIQDIKQTSSKWIHETIAEKRFAWQPGYGAFTVSKSNRAPRWQDTLRNQPEHHRKKSFQEEYVSFLKKHGVKYDERFLW